MDDLKQYDETGLLGQMTLDNQAQIKSSRDSLNDPNLAKQIAVIMTSTAKLIDSSLNCVRTQLAIRLLKCYSTWTTKTSRWSSKRNCDSDLISQSIQTQAGQRVDHTALGSIGTSRVPTDPRHLHSLANIMRTDHPEAPRAIAIGEPELLEEQLNYQFEPSWHSMKNPLRRGDKYLRKKSDLLTDYLLFGGFLGILGIFLSIQYERFNPPDPVEEPSYSSEHTFVDLLFDKSRKWGNVKLKRMEANSSEVESKQ